jgi:hypothetical protein
MTDSGVSSMRLTCGLSDAHVGAFSEAHVDEEGFLRRSVALDVADRLSAGLCRSRGKE